MEQKVYCSTIGKGHVIQAYLLAQDSFFGYEYCPICGRPINTPNSLGWSKHIVAKHKGQRDISRALTIRDRIKAEGKDFPTSQAFRERVWYYMDQVNYPGQEQLDTTREAI